MKSFSKIGMIGFLLSLFFVEGCKKETGPQGPAGPALTGTLYGFVTLEDQYGAKVLSGLNATTVTLTIPSTSAATTATTDSTGKFTFSNVSTGQYQLSFSNTGYGSIINSPLGFLGGGNIDHDVKLSAIPNFTIPAINVSDSAGVVTVTGTFSNTPVRKQTIAVFVGSSSSVSSAPANYLSFYSVIANNNLTTFTVKIQVSDLNDLGFTSGATVYLAAYGAATNFASTSEYEDLQNTGRLNFSSLSATAATGSVVLP